MKKINLNVFIFVDLFVPVNNKHRKAHTRGVGWRGPAAPECKVERRPKSTKVGILIGKSFQWMQVVEAIRKRHFIVCPYLITVNV